jgi:hypothetical protein
MQYLLLIYHDEQNWERLGDAGRQPVLAEFRRLREHLLSSGQYLGGAPLHPTSTATSVRLREGKRLVTDGPYAETREQLGGYFLVDAKDVDEAVGIAARIPPVRWGVVEVRPLVQAPSPVSAPSPG